MIKNIKKFYINFCLLYKAKNILKNIKPWEAKYLLCDPIFNVHKPFSFCPMFSAFALARKLNATPLFFYERNINKSELGIYRFLKLPSISVEELLNENIKKVAIKRPSSLKKIYKYFIGGIPVGRCIWDEVIWNKQCTIKKITDAMPSIKRAERYYEATKKIISSKNIVGGFFTHTTGIMSGIPIRVLMANGIDVYSGYGNLLKIKKLKSFNTKNGYVRPATDVNKKIFKENYNQKQLKNAALFFQKTFPISQSRGTEAKWLIAMHAFSDTPNGSMQYIFKDYNEWFNFTLIEIIKNKNVHWVIKPHPHRDNWPDDFQYEKIKKTIKPWNHITLYEEKWDFNLNKIGFSNLFSEMAGVLTCCGSLAIQFAAAGKQNLCCGDNFFTELNVINRAKTKKEYLKKIKEIRPTTTKSPRAKINNAQLAYYLSYKYIPSLLLPGNFTNWESYMEKEFLQNLNTLRSLDNDLNFL